MGWGGGGEWGRGGGGGRALGEGLGYICSIASATPLRTTTCGLSFFLFLFLFFSAFHATCSHTILPFLLVVAQIRGDMCIAGTRATINVHHLFFRFYLIQEGFTLIHQVCDMCREI